MGSNHLTHPLKPRPKTSYVIEMVGIPTWVYLLFETWLAICPIVKGIYTYWNEDLKRLMWLTWKVSPFRDTPCDLLWRNLSHEQSLHLLSQSRHSLNTDVPSSEDLTCFVIEKALLLLHLKQVYNEFSRAFCDFSSFTWLNQKQDVQKLDPCLFQLFFLMP